MRVRLRGINSKRKRLADGSFRTYYWAWKGGPPLRREPGTAEFVASYNEAVARRRAELCGQAMSKLANFRPFEIAEKALTNNVDALERLSDPDPRQAQMHQKLMRALEDLGAGIEATRRMVQERCKMREGGQRNAL